MYFRYCLVTLLAVFLTNDCLAAGGRRGHGRRHAKQAQMHSPASQMIGSMPKTGLDEQERNGLLLMREEEKLAHDVYVQLSRKWELPPLHKIPRSESMHMQAVKSLLDRYQIADPVKNMAEGKFSTPKMQTLYDQLVSQGERSIEDAINVGLLIEELDIADLNRLMQQVDNDDVRIIYQNLLKGSRNHLRAFWRQLEKYNSQYTAQHLSQKEFRRIALSKHERGKFISDPNFRF